jgi:hypothetical protein
MCNVESTGKVPGNAKKKHSAVSTQQNPKPLKHRGKEVAEVWNGVATHHFLNCLAERQFAAKRSRKPNPKTSETQRKGGNRRVHRHPCPPFPPCFEGVGFLLHKNASDR